LHDSHHGQALHSGEVFGDSIDRIIDFENGAVAELAGKIVRLEIVLRDADVFSFQFQPRTPQ